MSHWNQLSQLVLEAATNKAFQLPPIQHDASFVRLALALAELCHLVYLRSQDELDSHPHFNVPVQSPHGLAQEHSVEASLHHFRQAGTGRELASSQQFAVWEVGELGIVLAFRGTASFEDAIIDIAMTPVPLQLPRGRTDPHISLHGGFYRGILAVADEACTALRSALRRRRNVPVWFTGHSLGGGYAAALFVHLLAQRQLANMFPAGGGVMTFGAPMVLHSLDAAEMYTSLQQHMARHSPRGQQLHIHSFVNNADVVPRVLGPQLDGMYQAVHALVPSIQGVREVARQYLPFGRFHVMLGSTVRTVSAILTQAAVEGGSAGPPQQGLGSVADAEAVVGLLAAGQIWKSIYASGRGGAMQHHSMLLYMRNLRAHTSALAADSAARAEAAEASGFQQELLLFSGCPAAAPEQTPFHRLGEAAGDYSAALMSQAGSYLYSSTGDWWQHYWSRPTGQAGSSSSGPEQQRSAGAVPQPQMQASQGWGNYLPAFMRRAPSDQDEL